MSFALILAILCIALFLAQNITLSLRVVRLERALRDVYSAASKREVRLSIDAPTRLTLHRALRSSAGLLR